MTDPVLEPLTSDPEIAALLEEFCEFHLADGAQEEPWFACDSNHQLTVFGADAAGGRFALVQAVTAEVARVMYISSEGQAGVIAHTIADALALMITLPYWQDCLKFSGGGKLAEMIRAQTLMEQDLVAEFPEARRVRERLFGALRVNPATNPLRKLHEAVFGDDCPRILAVSDGWVFSSLGGLHVVESNPSWRER